MTATAGYQAGVEANQVVLSFGQEVTWGVLPPVAFQAVRLTSETLSSTKKRDRPGEFNIAGEVQAAITTQVSAGGNISFALSYATFDALMSAALDSDFGAGATYSEVAGDISSAVTIGTTQVITSTLANKFLGAAAGDWVRISGFGNPNNNGRYRVAAATGTTLTIYNPNGTAENPAGNAVAILKASRVTNGTTFKSFYFQKRLAPLLFLQYPGSYVSDMTISGGTSQFLNGSFTLLSKSEVSATADASTGAVTAAPAGRVLDPVGGFLGVFLNGVQIGSVVDSFSLQATSTGAALEFGMGQAAAQGVIAGLMEVKGSLKIYFRDFSLYALYQAETSGVLDIVASDAAGATYVFSVLNCNLMNPNVVAGGQNQAVMATFTIEGNPQAGGGSLSIYRV